MTIRSDTDLYIASYGLRFKLALSALCGVATVIVVAVAFGDASPSGSDFMFTVAAIVFSLLVGGLLLTIWRTRVTFKENGLLIVRPFRKSWELYGDLASIGRTAETVDLRFVDGSKASLNRHMADLASVTSILSVKAPGK
jgi:hypothetical protein